MTLPDELLTRAARLADAEGISLDAFLVRCVEDVVEWTEQTHAELDAAPSVRVGKPALANDLQSQILAANANAAAHVDHRSRREQELSANQAKLDEYRRQAVDGMKQFLAARQGRAEAKAAMLKPDPEPVDRYRGQRAFMRQIGAIKD